MHSSLYPPLHLLNILGQELSMEVIPDGIIDEPLLGLGLVSHLVLENHIIVPLPLNLCRATTTARSTIHVDIEREIWGCLFIRSESSSYSMRHLYTEDAMFCFCSFL